MSRSIELLPTPEEFDELARVAAANNLSIQQAAMRLLRLGLESNRVDDRDGIADAPCAYARDRLRAMGTQEQLVSLTKATAVALLDAIQPVLDALADADPRTAGLVASGQGRALRDYARVIATEHGFELPQEA